MKTLIYCRFLFKSRFDIPFTYFDRLLAIAVDENDDAPEWCKPVSHLFFEAALPGVWLEFKAEVEALCKRE